MWIAVDQTGMLGAFITAGEGEISLNAIQSTIINFIELEEKILQFPISSLAHLTTSVPYPNEFIAIAERGFFVYDWTDKNRYELVCIPKTPLHLKQLPHQYMTYLQALKLKHSLFQSTTTININLEFDQVIYASHH
ncbi:hypothetical protein [Acinetobacter sp. CFCC 10889]|uniref:hypothetical protein n=1 Tax=Acinetobacter sp. CFCC 10889 TaxID=1775557 RepID=UPI0013A6AA84|nr:hypothetical protein [Acinetobacter sp. CFCC 10889]